VRVFGCDGDYRWGIELDLVGFTAIVLILRQSIGGPLSPLDTLVARLFMSWGFLITYLSMLPMVLAAFKLDHTEVWQISSAPAPPPLRGAGAKKFPILKCLRSADGRPRSRGRQFAPHAARGCR
jgi:hypothetical protein